MSPQAILSRNASVAVAGDYCVGRGDFARTHNVSGFTLLELMVVIAILAIATAVALPNLSGWIQNARIENAAGHLEQDLQWARGYALKADEDVVVHIVQTASPKGVGNVCVWTLSDVAGATIAGAPGMTASRFAREYPNISCQLWAPAGVVNAEPFMMTPSGTITNDPPTGGAATFTTGTVAFGATQSPTRYSQWLVRYYGAGELRACVGQVAGGVLQPICVLS